MKFGVILPNFGATATRMAIQDSLIVAEKLGFDSAWLTDHIALPKDESSGFENIFESISTMAYLAGQTRTIKLGLSALVLPQRNPVEIAKSLATVDVLSGGRTIIATGIGWSKGEYENLGSNFQNRSQRMSEYIRILRTLWRGQSNVSFSGKYFKFSNLSFSPATIQPGGPPLWLAGNSIFALKRAVFLADGWHPHGTSPENIGLLINQVKPMIKDRPFTIAIRFQLSFESNQSQPGILSGKPEEIMELLNCYKMIGMNYAVIEFIANSQIERERIMKKFATEILPNFN